MMEWAAFLRDREEVYSGGVTRVRRTKVSPNDPRLVTDAKAINGSMLSGRRFPAETGYAQIYARHLCPLADTRMVVVELGVLLGVGIAVWSDVLPTSRIIGLDVDYRHFSLATLRERGAFEYNTPEVHFFDELAADAGKRLRNLLKGERIDVVIDDALHDDASILTAMETFLPFMADSFLYFIEDNDTVDGKIRDKYPELEVTRHGRLTVVTNG